MVVFSAGADEYYLLTCNSSQLGLLYLQINLNGCVERWCRRVLLTECKAVGAKLIITNGEEYAQTNGTNNMACCVACFPVWLLRTGIYKVTVLTSCRPK